MWRIALRALLALAAAALASDGQPEFSFGVVADVQYADKDTAGRRDYRASHDKLAACVAAMEQEKPAFLIQLGDLVDGGLAHVDRILPVFQRFSGPKYHVLGNHDLSVGRAVILQRLGLARGYYRFEVKDWHFIVLDGMEVSAGDAAGKKEYERLRAAGAPNAQEWNGGLGREQREWLHHRLHDATAVGDRAIVFCHFPVLAAASSPQHLLWDHWEVLALFAGEPATVAYIAGHDHRGGYAESGGVHFVTVKGLVESPPAESCKVFDVYPDRLVLRAAGSPAAERALRLRER